ncbi:MAG: pilus assembly protein TadG, partial [Planctomycetota bacterium]
MLVPLTVSAVVVSASTTVPTSLMSMFGYSNIPISVNCNARQDFVNTDIVLVLDTTGSMLQKAVSTDTQTKIEGIRSAVLALYDELAPAQTQLEAVGLRLRYGIVPYSVTVNAGNAIKSVSSSYIVDSWDYQSRKWEWDGTSYSSSTSNGNWSTTSTTYNPSSGYTTESTTTGVKSNTCTARSDTSTSYGSPTAAGSPTTTTDANDVRTTTTPSTRSGTYTDYNDTWTKTSGNGGNALGTCVRRSRTVTVNQSGTVTLTETPQYAWVYKQVNYPTSQFKLGVSVSTPTGNNGANVNSTWRGCIEERDTDSSITSSSTAATSDAHDLNIDEIPTNDGTKWRP